MGRHKKEDCEVYELRIMPSFLCVYVCVYMSVCVYVCVHMCTVALCALHQA